MGFAIGGERWRFVKTIPGVVCGLRSSCAHGILVVLEAWQRHLPHHPFCRAIHFFAKRKKIMASGTAVMRLRCGGSMGPSRAQSDPFTAFAFIVKQSYICPRKQNLREAEDREQSQKNEYLQTT
nr:hypothetical protein CFP56_71684 [Quercus suber]